MGNATLPKACNAWYTTHLGAWLAHTPDTIDVSQGGVAHLSPKFPSLTLFFQITVASTIFELSTQNQDHQFYNSKKKAEGAYWQ